MLQRVIAAFALLLTAVTALLFALLSPAGAPTAPARAQTDDVLVRFVHAVPNTPPIDIYIDGARVVQSLSLGSATPHLRFAAGEVEIVVRQGGSNMNTPTITTRTLNLATTGGGFGHVAVVFQLDGFQQPSLTTYEDILTPTNFGNSRLQVIHTVPDGPNLDVYTAAGAFYVPDVAYATSTSVDPPVGAVSLQLRAAGLTRVLAEVPDVDLSSGFLYTILALPAADGAVEAVLLSAPVLPQPGIATTQVQLVHAASAAGPLDVYFDNAAVVPNIVAGDVVVHAPYPTGNYTLSVRNAGIPANATPAAELPISISGDAVTLVLSGNLSDGTFRVDVLEDFVFSMDADSARVRVVNGSRNGPLTLDLDVGEPSARNLANILAPGGATMEQTLPAGFYDVSAVVDDTEIDGPFFLEQAAVAFEGGAEITLLVYNDADTDAPTLRITSSYLATGPRSLLGFVEAPPPTPTPSLTPTSTNTPLPPTLTPTPFTGTPPAPLEQPLIYALVNLAPNTNLQCREYPSQVARVLTNVPGRAPVVVRGYATELDPNLSLVVPLDPANFVDSEAATAFDRVWLQVDYFDPEDNLARCWVRADFLEIFFYDGQQNNAIGSPAGLFGFIAISPPLIVPIPANSAGLLLGQGIANRPLFLEPTATPRATLTVTPLPSATPSMTPTPDASGRAQVVTLTQIYERANVNTTVLREIPSGSVVSLLGRTLDGTLVNVRYEALGEGTTIGWVAVAALEIIEGDLAALPVVN